MRALALILAGGRGERIGGEKPAKSLWGKPLLYWAIKPYLELKMKVALAVREPLQEEFLKGLLREASLSPEEFIYLKDEPSFEGQGPLSGLYSAMLHFPKDTLLVTSAVDQPLLSSSLLAYLLSLGEVFLSSAILCERQGKLEPFPGVYAVSLLPELEEYLNKKEQKKSLQGFISYLRSLNLLVTFRNWHKIDPEGQSFLNINYLEDLEKVATCFFPKLI